MNIEPEETSQLIAADRVDGTNLYGRNGDKAGTVKSVMINKRTGRVEHVVADIGSFLGMGGELHTLPWNRLDYDTNLNGYRMNVTDDQLKEGPTLNDTNNRFSRDYEDRVYGHYGSTPYYA
ncbi:MAG: PRC-barrel domain-containing protein [Pacificimonas sp.]